MGNGLFAVDGVDVAALVAEHLGPRMLPVVLYKPGAVVARDPLHPTRAPSTGDPTPHKCRGMIQDFSQASIDGQLIIVGDRKVTILADTIQGGVEPGGGPAQDQIEIEGRRYNVVRVLARDPAGATYTLQVRD